MRKQLASNGLLTLNQESVVGQKIKNTVVGAERAHHEQPSNSFHTLNHRTTSHVNNHRTTSHLRNKDHALNISTTDDSESIPMDEMPIPAQILRGKQFVIYPPTKPF